MAGCWHGNLRNKQQDKVINSIRIPLGDLIHWRFISHKQGILEVYRVF